MRAIFIRVHEMKHINFSYYWILRRKMFTFWLNKREKELYSVKYLPKMVKKLTWLRIKEENKSVLNQTKKFAHGFELNCDGLWFPINKNHVFHALRWPFTPSKGGAKYTCVDGYIFDSILTLRMRQFELTKKSRVQTSNVTDNSHWNTVATMHELLPFEWRKQTVLSHQIRKCCGSQSN